jgi:hypothetical protein
LQTRDELFGDHEVDSGSAFYGRPDANGTESRQSETEWDGLDGAKERGDSCNCLCLLYLWECQSKIMISEGRKPSHSVPFRPTDRTGGGENGGGEVPGGTRGGI